MTKNPYLNGLAAFAYIVTIVSVLQFGMKSVTHPNEFVIATAMISLFTLSAAMMGYIFCYQPAQLYFDGKKKQAATLFLKTILSFAAITAIVFTLLFSKVIPS